MRPVITDKRSLPAFRTTYVRSNLDCPSLYFMLPLLFLTSLLLRLASTCDRGSGYDRGHLAPAADHKGSQKAMNSTFNLSNISPQVGEGFNRDYWARFEKFVKDTTKYVNNTNP